MRAKTMHNKIVHCFSSDSLHRALSKTTSFHILIYFILYRFYLYIIYIYIIYIYYI